MPVRARRSAPGLSLGCPRASSCGACSARPCWCWDDDDRHSPVLASRPQWWRCCSRRSSSSAISHVRVPLAGHRGHTGDSAPRARRSPSRGPCVSPRRARRSPAGAALAWRLRRSLHAVWAVPLAIVVVRVALDPSLNSWYLQAVQTLAIVGAVAILTDAHLRALWRRRRVRSIPAGSSPRSIRREPEAEPSGRRAGATAAARPARSAYLSAGVVPLRRSDRNTAIPTATRQRHQLAAWLVASSTGARRSAGRPQPSVFARLGPRLHDEHGRRTAHVVLVRQIADLAPTATRQRHQRSARPVATDRREADGRGYE